jgi:Protein of unknown function (DUF2971)
MRAYKFLAAPFALKSLRERRLKISTIEDLNDPFELIPYELSNRSNRAALRKSRDQLAANRGVLCFSTTWHDPVVWAHYSDKHRGICLAFDVPSDLDLYKKVRYVSNRLPFPRMLNPETAEKMLFTKYHNWSYEKEMRTWAALNDQEHGLYFYNFSEHLRLVRVIAGARCSVPKQEIMEALGPLASGVGVMKARAGYRKFEIVPNQRGFT